MKFQQLINTKMLNQKAFLAFKLSAVAFIMLINVKMPTIVGILTFMSRINFVLSSVEHEFFYNLRARLEISELCDTILLCIYWNVNYITSQ